MTNLIFNPNNSSDTAKAPKPTTSQSPLADMIMSSEQLAELLGVSAASLLRWHHQRIGPPRIKIPGTRKAYYWRSDVEAYLRAVAKGRAR